MTDMKLDEFDFAILGALKVDGALSNAELSEKVALSPSQCSRRRNRLEQDGVILGYQAKLNNEALGLGLRAVTRINLLSHSEESALKFGTFVEVSREIEAAYSVSGDADYVLLIVTEDLKSFAEFVHTRLLPFPNVTQVRSDIVLQGLKEA
jgi:DNA-binding Lrp family transcriptional regulator